VRDSALRLALQAMRENALQPVSPVRDEGRPAPDGREATWTSTDEPWPRVETGLKLAAAFPLNGL